MRLGFERPAMQDARGKILSPVRHPRCDRLAAQPKTQCRAPKAVDEFIETDTDDYLACVQRWRRRQKASKGWCCSAAAASARAGLRPMRWKSRGSPRTCPSTLGW